jgi:hypothetical protein
MFGIFLTNLTHILDKDSLIGQYASNLRDAEQEAAGVSGGEWCGHRASAPPKHLRDSSNSSSSSGGGGRAQRF